MRGYQRNRRHRLCQNEGILIWVDKRCGTKARTAAEGHASNVVREEHSCLTSQVFPVTKVITGPDINVSIHPVVVVLVYSHQMAP